MADIPREILSDHLQERLSGKRLLGAIFLAFEFDPGFFEQEVLPVILDTPVSHAEVARLLQLEDALRAIPLGVAVFYDLTGLRSSSYSPPRLDVQRLPVRLNTGIFHTKNVLLLTEDEEPDDQGARKKRLLVATLSANLTRSGWWENVEACHIEEIESGASTRMKDSLTTLLRRVERLTANTRAAEILRPYRDFLATLDQGAFKSSGGALYPHFFVGGGGDGDDLSTFLRAHIPRNSGYRLEVLSPFFDKHAANTPLDGLVRALNPEEVRVYLPQDFAGAAQCSEEMFDHVQGLGDHVHWGCLPDELLALGRSADAGRRSVHAKVYRVFKPYPKTEFVFIGSVNLTAPGHSGRGGNLETGILLQLDPASRPDFWLRPFKRKPALFHPVAPEDELEEDSVLPVQVRFSWKTRSATARWDVRDHAPAVTVCGAAGPMGSATALIPQAWTPLSAEIAECLANELISTSIVTVRTDDGRESKVLVQEEDMGLKPELLRTLPVRDILQYWSLLKPEQRQAFLDSRAPLLSTAELGGLMARIDDGGRLGNDIFERCAGVFHAFGQLEARVSEALKDGRSGQAAALLFGERFDSLPTVIDRVLRGDREDAADGMSETDRYLVLLCGIQLCDRVRKEAPEFWADYQPQAVALQQRLQQRSALRDALCADDPAEMPAFLEWFDRWFLQRAEPVERT